MSKQYILEQFVSSTSVLILLVCVKSLIRLFILANLCFEDKNRCCLVENVTIKIRTLCY